MHHLDVRRPEKGGAALVVRGHPDLIGSILTVKKFGKHEGLFKTVVLVDDNKKTLPPEPIENVTRVEHWSVVKWS